MKKVWIGLIVIVLIACGGYYAYVHNHKKAERTNTEGLANRNVYTVKRGSITKSISTSGNLIPVKEQDLKFSATGIVKSMYVKAGDRVQKGQVLAVLENLESELNLKKAQSSYEESKINASPSVQEERRMELQIAQKNFDNTKLIAPFSGVITALDLETNDEITGSGVVVGHLMDDSRYELDLNIDEADIFSLKAGQKAVVQLDSLPDEKLSGEVTFVGSAGTADGGVVAFPVKVEVPANPMIKAGLSSTVEIIIAEEGDVLVVPVTSVIQHGKEAIVMKMIDGKPTLSPVTKGISNDSIVQIVEGLNEGDQIVLNNSQVIRELRNQASNQNNNRQGNFMMQGMTVPAGGPGGRR